MDRWPDAVPIFPNFAIAEWRIITYSEGVLGSLIYMLTALKIQGFNII